ncbi:diacylglyceryl transferase [Bacillus cereus]|nr:diacylglyceryl transferase [Bacillus cereus]
MLDWMIKIQPISPIFGGLLGLVFIKLKLRSQSIPYERIMETLINSFLIIILTWKLSPIISNPLWAVQSPGQALLTVGSFNHVIFGCFIASGYIIWKSKKTKLPISVLFDVLPFGIGGILIFYFLFHQHVGTRTEMPWGIRIHDSHFLYHPISIYEIITSLCILGWFSRKKEAIGTRKYISYFFVIEGIINTIISLISEQTPLLFGLSVQQLFSFALISVGILLLKRK